MSIAHTPLTLALLIFSLTASAQVYRCTTPTGKTEYRDGPCVGSIGRAVNIKPNTLPPFISNQPASSEDRRQARTEPEPEAARTQAVPSPPGQVIGRTDADLQAEKSGSIECTRAKRSYEVATSSIQQDRNVDAERLAMYSACGMKPPDQTIISVTQVTIGNSTTPALGLRCDSRGCVDELGNRYQRGPGGILMGPRGTCRQLGARLVCP